jgi:glyoxylate reductase
MGRIGRAVAWRARGFNMKILYHNRQRLPEWEEKLGVQYTSKETLLAEADIIVVLTSLTKQTHHLIGEPELAQMKPTAILINAARGPIVDFQALYQALRDGVIAGAGLDVFDPEPPLANDPLLALDNVVFTPHLGSATVRTRTQMAMMSAENLLAGLRGESLPHWVNSQVTGQ